MATYKTKITCKYCGKKYFSSGRKPGGKYYCSVKCKLKDTRKIKINCAVCEKEVEIFPSRLKKNNFCSRKCANTFRRGKIIAIRCIKKCDFCGRTFKVCRDRAKQRFCNQKCSSSWLTLIRNVGENHPRYINGAARSEYPSEFNESFKAKVRKRDNYKCKICNNFGKEVHHIDYNKENTHEDNCITLCRSCHAKTNSNRKYWQDKLRKELKYVNASIYNC